MSSVTAPLTDAERDFILRENKRIQKLNKKTGRLVLSIPESVNSDEPNAPSSPRSRPTTFRYGLELHEVFPSLLVPTRMIRQALYPALLDDSMEEPELVATQFEQLLTIVPILCSCIGSIMNSIRDSEFRLTASSAYLRLEERTTLTNVKLARHVEWIGSGIIPRTDNTMDEVLVFVESVIGDLKLLVSRAEKVYRGEIKPLPPLPREDIEEPQLMSDLLGSDSEERHPSDPNLDAALETPGSDATDMSPADGGCDSAPESPVPDVTGPPCSATAAPKAAPATLKGKKRALIRRVLQLLPGDPEEKAHSAKPKRRLFAVASPDAKKSASTPTLVDAQSPARSPSESPADDNPYILRQTCIYGDLFDPLSEQKVLMPLPVGDAVAIRLDSDGNVKAATLAAIILMLTSHHDVADELRGTFFLSFRLFSSPQWVLAALIARWDVKPPLSPTALTPSQRRVWLKYVDHVHNCVAELILTWLDEYWRPLQDQRIFNYLRRFVQLNLTPAHIKLETSTLLLEAIHCIETKANTPRVENAKDVQRGSLPSETSSFEIPLHLEDDYTLNISVFETGPGRERFARQLTYVAHTLFRSIDPEEAVALWMTSKPTFFELQKFEEELLFWVAQSILALRSREDRASMMEFWLDVATICVRLRNFSTASAIFGGLVFSPVERLSLTILDLATSSKEQYRKLNAIFDGTNNFAVYRRALAANDYPAVPHMTVLRKDAISASEVSGPVALTNDPDAPKTLIHFSAFRMLKKTICIMEGCLAQYKIKPVPIIQDWIQAQLAVLPREKHVALTLQMDARSRELEGRPPPPIQKGQMWLQTLTGSIANGTFTLHPLPDSGTAQVGGNLRKTKSIASLLNLRTGAVSRKI
ncbi:ras guanine nucleotide exchange factor domain-containing protein [Mycena crocata]|nr:ras guanine nucleotide exchange factor domain-containing protein [Mycena crocata]